MNRNLRLPVDFVIKPIKITSFEENAKIMGFKQYHDGYSPIGDARIGILPFLVAGKSMISYDEIENYVDERDAVGSSVWRHFVNDLSQVPESWEYNLYFSSFFNSPNPNNQKTKYIFCLTKGSGFIFKPLIKPIYGNFIPKENDRLVCIVY